MLEEEVPTRHPHPHRTSSGHPLQSHSVRAEELRSQSVISQSTFLAVTHCVPLLRRTGGGV